MNEIISENYTKAVTLHRRICANAQAAQESLYEMCRGLKEMRDGKLYKELGYGNFEDYTQSELGMGRSQAYKLIDISTKLSEDFVHTSGQIGVSKLHLLAMLNDSDRTEIVQNTDLESTSVRELEEQIKQLREKEEGYRRRQDNLLTRNKELVSEKSELEKKLDEVRDESRETVQSLERQIQELESKPRDSYEDTTKINELAEQLRQEQSRHATEIEQLREKYTGQSSENADAGLIFRAYMESSVDAMKRLTAYCEEHADSREVPLFLEKLGIIVTLTERTINKLKGV